MSANHADIDPVCPPFFAGLCTEVGKIRVHARSHIGGEMADDANAA